MQDFKPVASHHVNTLPAVVGIAGASGAVLACGVIDQLLSMEIPVIATASPTARIIWRDEMDESFGDALERWDGSGRFIYSQSRELASPIASGSFPTLGMVVVPCSVATVSAIAHGLADTLLRRAADVCIKERRPLVLIPREAPLSAIHLDNMAALSRLGVTILPPEPAFYLGHQTVTDIVDFVTQRTLLALGIIDALPKTMQYQGPASK